MHLITPLAVILLMALAAAAPLNYIVLVVSFQFLSSSSLHLSKIKCRPYSKTDMSYGQYCAKYTNPH